MLAFFIKKSFFDGWDHIAALTLVNVGFLVSVLPFLGMGIHGMPLALTLALAALAVLLFSCWFAFSAIVTMRYSDYGDFAFEETLPAMRRALVPGLQLGIIGVAIAVVAGVGLPFYMGQGLFGSLAAGILAWTGIALVIALQYYLPLRFRLGGGFFKNLRKSFILFFDNPLFSLFLFAWSLAAMIVSAFLAFLVPGAAGVSLAQNDALRLKLKKYDWLESRNKGEGRAAGQRTDIPWKELLAEEEELLGPRSLKGMIFPWKE